MDKCTRQKMTSKSCCKMALKLSQIVNEQGLLLICVNEVSNENKKYIAAYPVLFENGDGKGYLVYDLWYTKAKLASKEMVSRYRNREELLEAASDYFILVPHHEEDSSRTVLCKSWRVRHKTGELKLPTPSRETLLDRSNQLINLWIKPKFILSQQQTFS